MRLLNPKLAVPFADDPLTREVEQCGLLTPPPLAAWLEPHIPECGLAIDIGAALGDTTALIRKHAQFVWAFEPNPLWFECLKHNCPDCICIPVCLGHDNRMAAIDYTLSTLGSTRVVRHGVCSAMMTLDTFGLDPKFIKIDAEGCELDILHGAEQTIAEYRPIMVMEVNDEALRLQGSSADRLLRYVADLNYDSKRIYGCDAIYDLLLTPK